MLIADFMDTWDEEKLRNVVNQNGRKQRTTTDVGILRDMDDIAHNRSSASTLSKLLRTRSTAGCEYPSISDSLNLY